MAPSTTPPPGSSGLTPGQRLRVRLEGAAAQGRVVAHCEGRALLVAGGAPGEDVDVEVERVEARHALARVVAVHAASPERVEAPCPHYGRCGGCDLQHLAYPAQVAFKRQAFLDQLTRIGGLEAPPGFEIVPAPEALRYRDRLEFRWVSGADGRSGPAFHAAHGGPAVPIEDCRLAPPELTRLAHAAGQALGAASGGEIERVRVEAFEPQGGGSAALSLTLVAASSGAARRLLRRREPWLSALRAAVPALAHVAVAGPDAERGQNRERGQDRERGPNAERAEDEAASGSTAVHGEAEFEQRGLEKRVGAWSYRVPPGAFFQVHGAQAAGLVSYVAAEVSAQVGGPRQPATGAARTAPVFDLFCGVGLFSLPLAAAGYRVLGVEASEAAVRAARQTAREAQARQAFPSGRKPEFKVRNLDEKGALEDLVRQAGPAAAIVADPPRRGLSAHLTRSLAALRPGVIVYVSCDGGTFARDAARLSARYTLTRLRGYDLFPQTHHLEVVGTFLPRPG